MNNNLEDILQNIDNQRESLEEFEIARRIEKEFNGEKDNNAYVYEIFAFDLAIDSEESKKDQGSYYKPKSALKNENGDTTDYPDISKIDGNMISYWNKRVSETEHPVMRARYADLVWNLSKQITGKNPDHTRAREVIESNILIIKEKLYNYETSMKTKLERSLNLASSLRDKKEIQKIKDIILDTEDNIPHDSKPGLWGFSFDLLLEKKFELNEEEELRIITGLEHRIKRLNSYENAEPWAVQAGAVRLATYYHQKGSRDDVLRVLKMVEQEFNDKMKTAVPIQKQAWLESLHELFIQYQINEEAERVSKRLVELGKEVKESLLDFSSSIEVSEQDINDMINYYVSDDVYKDIYKISCDFIPKKEKAKEQILDRSKNNPLEFLFTKSLLGEDGRKIAELGSLDDDLKGNIIFQISRNIPIFFFFFNRILDELKIQHDLNADNLLELLMRSPVFDKNKKDILYNGLEMYFQENFIASIHILIPQIENAFRRIIYLSGGATLNPKKNYGGYMVKLFGPLLNDPIIDEVFEEDSSTYFKILFTDQRGLNIRNNVCHGLSNSGVFDKTHANLLIHVLFI